MRGVVGDALTPELIVSFACAFGTWCRSGPVVIDARMKEWYPKEVEADPEVARRVEARWGELFPERKVEMGHPDGHVG